MGDRETLENLAAKIPATGTIIKPNGEPLLIFGRRNMAIGSHFTVAMCGDRSGIRPRARRDRPHYLYPPLPQRGDHSPH